MNTRNSKEEQIRWQNALNCTSSIFQGQMNEDQEEHLKERIYSLANFFYGIEPARTDIESKIESANTIEDLNVLKEEIVKSDSVALFNAWNDKKIKLS